MIIFIRSFYVIYRLRKNNLKNLTILGDASISSGETWSNEQKFLENLSSKMFLIIPRAQKSKENRMRKDKLIIGDFALQDPAMIEEKPWGEIFTEHQLDQLKIKHSDMAIRITGPGYKFSHISNGFSGFLKEYKEAFWIIIIAILAIASFSPALRPLVIKLYSLRS